MTKEEEIRSTQNFILTEAGKITKSDRNKTYGEPEDNFWRIALFWQAYFESTGRPEACITASDVSPLMRLMKESRLCNTPDHLDSFVDIVGYTLTGVRVEVAKKYAQNEDEASPSEE